MSSRALVRRNNGGPVVANQRMAVAAARNILRRAIRRRARHRVGQLARRVAAEARQRMARNNIVNRNRALHRRHNRTFYKVVGNAGGTTHTTTRMIVRKTPRSQKFIRKIFKNNPIKVKYVNRFGFAWMGQTAASKTQWYSICHLKFNNVARYYHHRVNDDSQQVGQEAMFGGMDPTHDSNRYGANPNQFIYLGKCTFSYELYNPTNYNMTIWIYDLICKRDTEAVITYSDAENTNSAAPENLMYKGSRSMKQTPTGASVKPWEVSDPTYENGTYWNTIGMKPTDYHLFNTFWKVKGIKKLVLPPTTSHHHTVVFNPKTKITSASLFYPREKHGAQEQLGLAGITQATLFGFQGQVATENDTSTDATDTIGTLPGKLLVNCVRKINVWNTSMSTEEVISENALINSFNRATIFSDLVETNAMAT